MFSISQSLTNALNNNLAQLKTLDPFKKYQIPKRKHPNIKYENLVIITWDYNYEKILKQFKNVASQFFYLALKGLPGFKTVYTVEPRINYERVIVPLFINNMLILNLDIKTHELLFIRNLFDSNTVDIDEIYKTIMSFLNLDPVDKLSSTWFDIYWQYLFTLSLLSNNNKVACEYLGLAMYNFYSILLCAVCGTHYQANDPYKNVTIPIIATQDPTTVLFNLKNMINLTKKTPVQNIKILDTLFGATPESSYVATILVNDQQQIKFVDIKKR